MSTQNDSLQKWIMGSMFTILLLISGGSIGLFSSKLGALQEELRHHESTKGHPVIETRVGAIEKSLQDLRSVNESLSDNVQKLVRNQVRMCAKENVTCEQ